MGKLGVFAELAVLLIEVALGISLIYSWALLLSSLGITCPTLDGKLINKLLLIPADSITLIAISLLSIPSLLLLDRRIIPVLLVPLPLTYLGLRWIPLLIPVICTVLLIVKHRQWIVVRGLLLGAATVSIGNIVYTVLRILEFTRTELCPLPPLFLSLYCVIAPVIPPLVLLFYYSTLYPMGKVLLEKESSEEWEGRIGIPSILLLVLSVVIGISLWYVVYFSKLNPTGRFIGVDPVTRYYPHLIKILKSSDQLKAVLKIGYDRPLHYLIMWALAQVLDPVTTVKVLLLICLVLYPISVYLSTKVLLGEEYAGLAAILSSISYTTTTGIFGGLYSNWMCLSTSLLSALALKKWLEERKYWLGPWLLATIVSILLHAYMGAVLLASLALTSLAIIVLKKDKFSRLNALAVLVITILLGLAAWILVPRVIVGNTMLWYRRLVMVIGTGRIFDGGWWDDFSFALYNYAATSGLDAVGWILALVGVLSMRLRRVEDSIQCFWTLVAGGLSVLAPRNLIYRALFDIPVSLIETMGLVRIVSLREIQRFKSEVIAAVLLFKLSFSLNHVVGLVV